jgi:hypothetical protein
MGQPHRDGKGHGEPVHLEVIRSFFPYIDRSYWILSSPLMSTRFRHHCVLIKIYTVKSSGYIARLSEAAHPTESRGSERQEARLPHPGLPLFWMRNSLLSDYGW